MFKIKDIFVNYSTLINATIILLLVIGSLSAGPTYSEVVDQYLEEGGVNGERWPLFYQDGSMMSLEKGQRSSLEIYDNPDTLRKVESVSWIWMSASIWTNESQITKDSLYYANEVIWQELGGNSSTDAIVIGNQMTSMENISIPALGYRATINNSLAITPNNLPYIFTRVQSEGSMVLLPLETYQGHEIIQEHKIIMDEFYYLREDVLRSTESTSEVRFILYETWDQVKEHYQQYPNYDPGETSDGTRISDLLRALERIEREQIETFTGIIYFSVFKILFLEIMILLGFRFLMQQRHQEMELRYSRGFSIPEIRNRYLKQLGSSLFFVVLLTTMLLSFLDLTDQMRNFVLSVSIPWLILYYSASTYIVLRQIRFFQQKLIDHKPQTEKSTSSIPLRKILLGFVIYFIGRAVLNIGFPLQYTKFFSFIIPALFFLAIVGLFRLVENSSLQRKSQSQPDLHLELLSFNRRKLVLVILFFLIVANIGVTNSYQKTEQRQESHNDSFGLTGNFEILFRNYEIPSLEQFTSMPFENIENLQSHLVIYSSVLNINYADMDNPNTLNYLDGYTLYLINETQYQQFECDNCLHPDPDTYFDDKLWMLDYYYPLVKYHNQPIPIESGEKEMMVDPAVFQSYKGKPGVLKSGNNHVTTSLSFWKDLGFNYDIEQGHDLRVLISFEDASISESEAYKRVIDAIGGGVPFEVNKIINEDVEYVPDIPVLAVLDVIFYMMVAIAGQIILINGDVRRQMNTLYHRYGSKFRVWGSLAIQGLTMALGAGIFAFLGNVVYYTVFDTTLMYYKVLEWVQNWVPSVVAVMVPYMVGIAGTLAVMSGDILDLKD